MTSAKELQAARAEVNRHQFGTPAWEAAMQIVRDLVSQVPVTGEFTSVDSGWHRTRLPNGRIV